ncbi:MAG TPA: ABC transporter permease [Ferruginibacter sp.]|nr:ABC transporter permease [Ferruginibacter sp.]HPH89851.1 ABC transporter permease [Ferruginibacter sp.]
MSSYKEKDGAWDLVIGKGYSAKNYWKDLWRYRELFYILSWRDIKVRYKQTVVGAAWSVIRPLLTSIVFYFVFNKIANLDYTGEAPYILMVFVGMLPWSFFSNALSESSNSLIGNSNLITKVYFPRLIVPASSVITTLVDFAISFGIMLVMMAWFRFVPGWQIVLLPAFILLAFICAFGFGLLLTALNVKYRDFRYIIPFVIQFGLYITPVGYTSSHALQKLSPGLHWLFQLNPMVGVIDGFRFCLLGDPIEWQSLLNSIIISLVFLILGLFYFRRMEKSFADNI